MNNDKRLFIYGAGGHGRVIADISLDCGWGDVAFFDDAWPQKQENGVWPILGDWQSMLSQLGDAGGVIVAIGNNQHRLSYTKNLVSKGSSLATLVHPEARVSQYAKLSPGVVVMPRAIVNIGSNIGMAALINTGATIDHDCVIGDGVHVSPGANLAGGIEVGEESWIGIGSSIIEKVRVGRKVTVGAGAVVLTDVSSNQTVVGVPAKPIKELSASC